MRILEKVDETSSHGRRTSAPSDGIADQKAPPVSDGAPTIDGADDDFLARERAALGDDAALFASSSDNAATVQDGEDDLLGGGGNYNEAKQGGEEITEFESSYPAVNTQNNVSYNPDPYQIPQEEAKLDLSRTWPLGVPSQAQTFHSGRSNLRMGVLALLRKSQNQSGNGENAVIFN